MSEPETMICPICTRSYQPATPLMLGCEICPIWMHAKCLGVKKAKYPLMDEDEAQDKTIYCPTCTRVDPAETEKRKKKNNEILTFLSAKAELITAYNKLTHNLEPGDTVSTPVRAIVQKRAQEDAKRNSENGRGRNNNNTNDEANRGTGPIITLTVSGVRSSDESDSNGDVRGNGGGGSGNGSSTGKDRNALSGTQQNGTRTNSRAASRASQHAPEKSTILLKPQNEYQIFKSAVTAANPGQSHEEIQLLALHEWALLGPSEKRKYTNDASKRRAEHGKIRDAVDRSSPAPSENKRSRGNSPKSPKPKKRKK